MAFELAQSQRRASVHCATKADVLELTEGMMLRTFERVAAGYPHIAPHHLLVDKLAHPRRCCSATPGTTRAPRPSSTP